MIEGSEERLTVLRLTTSYVTRASAAFGVGELVALLPVEEDPLIADGMAVRA